MLKTQACLLIVAALLVSEKSWAQGIFDRQVQNNQPELLEPEAQPQTGDHLGAEGGPLNGSTTPSGTSTTTPTDGTDHGNGTGSTTQTTKPSAPVKAEPDPAQVCSDYFLKHHPKLLPIVTEHQYCAESPLRSLFTTYSSEWERNSMSRCLKALGDDVQVNSKLINRCTSYGFRGNVDDGSYRNCVTEVVAAHHTKPDAIQACSEEYGSSPARVVIETCANDLHDTRFMSFERDAICGNQTARREFRTNPEILDCIAKGRDVAQMKVESATASCVMSTRRSSILSTDFAPCLAGLTELGLNHQGRNVCLDTPSAYVRVFPDPAFRSCALRGKSAGYDLFFKLQTAVTDATYGNETDVLSDCKKDLTAPKAAAGPWTARVLGDLHLHTSSAWKFDYHWDPINIGGLSGISYDPVSGKFVTVSDSKRLSAVFQMTFQLPTEPGQVLKLDGISMTDIGSGFQVSEMLDHEDIALTKNGDMIISSELSIDTKKEDRDLQIVRYTPRGNLESKIRLPKDFEPGYEKKQTPVPSDSAPLANGGGSSGSDSFSKSNPNGYTSSGNSGYNTGGGSSHGGQFSGGQGYSAPAPQTSGLTANSGIEGIALSPDETYLIAANEKALKQDAEGSVRLAILSIVEKADNSAAPMLTYTLDKLPGAGLVAMAFADPTTLLTLERGFDDITHKNSVRIYKSKLEIQAGLPVAIGAKKLIADIFLMVPQFSPGFRAIDNFEGMTFGPTLPSGNRTLVLVSDNNFNVHGQRTAFVVLEVAKDALN